MLIDEEGVQIVPMVAEPNGSKVALPSLHEWAAAVVGEGTYPALFPMPVAQKARVGQLIELAVRVVNARNKAIRGTLRITPPEGWQTDKHDLPVSVGPGKAEDIPVTLTVPETAEKEVYFIKFSLSGLEQRALVFVEDGKPRSITENINIT